LDFPLQLMTSSARFDIEMSSLPKLKNPKLICGLPGSGYVGKLAVDFLIEHFHGEKFADIYSSSFPPQLSINIDGTADLIKNSLYFCKSDSQDLIFLTGEAQPVSAQAEYALAEEIIKICKQLGVDSIYTLAAYITGKFSQVPKVYGTGTSSKIVDALPNFGAQKMNKGNITGMNGVVIGVAKKSRISGICLLGETSGYVIDAKASKAVLEILSKILKLKLNMEELNKRVEDTNQVIKSLESQVAKQQQAGGQVTLPTHEEKKLDYIS